eukprot:NODE_362_length_10118_cov_0.149117.p3 type:complete len:421 gc:universal NODE_362_length_10118_cov_0.149117:8224-9486(+)
MNLVNCSLDEVNKLAEWHQNEAKIAKQSIPKLVSQHYQHLLYIDTKPLQWLPIDAKSVPHKKDSFVDFIISACLHERHWIKHYKREIQNELLTRLSNCPFNTTVSLYPSHQTTIDLFLALMFLNKWSLADCWLYIVSLISILELPKLLNIIKWSSYFDAKSKSNLYNQALRYKEFIQIPFAQFDLELKLDHSWQLSPEKDPNVAISLLSKIKNEIGNMPLILSNINDLLKSIQTEIMNLLKNSIFQTSLFAPDTTNIQRWDQFATNLASMFKNVDYDRYKGELNKSITEWSSTLKEQELFKLYFSLPIIREFIRFPSSNSFESSEKEPWVFDLVDNPCRFPYIPAPIQLDGFKQFELTEFQQDTEFPITTYREFAQVPVLKQTNRSPPTSTSFSKSMSIERVTQSFQKPSIFKYAKSMFD